MIRYDLPLSAHFVASELLPRRMLSRTSFHALRLELYLATQAARTILEPLRLITGPLIINQGRAQARGWRDMRGINDAGSSPGSDHALLSLNPWAAGAFDLGPIDRSVGDLFAALVGMDVAGEFPYPCRSIMYESRNGAEWVHVGWPDFKRDPSFIELAGSQHAVQCQSRTPYEDRATGLTWRYWSIKDRELRVAVNSDLSPAVLA